MMPALWADRTGMPAAAARPSLVAILIVLAAAACAAQPASAADDHFAAAERARYAALCRARKDWDSCSDAVRWSPGDPALLVALADSLVRARRLPEAIRDYRRAEALAPNFHGLDAKIKTAETKLNQGHAPKKPAVARAVAEKPASPRYSNADPETQSH